MSRCDRIVLAVVALLFAALDITLSVVSPEHYRPGLVLLLAGDISLLLLPRAPRLVTWYFIAVSLAILGSDVLAPGLLVPVHPLTLMTVPPAVAVVTSSIVRLVRRPEALLYVGIFAVLASRPWLPRWDTVPFGLLATVTPAAVSLYTEARRQLLRSLRDRVDRAEREQLLLAERARAEERRRLAAEMHDVVTHRLSLMVLHAGALGVSTKDPSVTAAAADIRAAGTEALRELRDLVGVLRGEGEGEDRATEPAPAPDPGTLVTESAAAGMEIDYVVRGEAGTVSPTVGRTAYRVLQEALTNVRKHAPGAPVRVELSYRDDGVRLRVHNGTATREPDPVLAGTGGGAGLLGLRQRVDLVGGRLDAVPEPGGRFRVDAILPAYVPTAGSAGHDPGGGRR